MTDIDHLGCLKRVVKDHARANSIKLHLAQNEAAKVLGLAHWPALTRKIAGGWEPTEADVARVRSALQGESYPEEGFIGPHPYRLTDILRDTRMTGRGWCIFIGENPSSKPQMLITDRRFKVNPITDPEFVAKALPIALWKARQVRAQIARDWPRNSTMPDADGRVRHPLFGGHADRWTCYHCDSKWSGQEIADNLWHCPKCGATPLDMSPDDTRADDDEFVTTTAP